VRKWWYAGAVVASGMFLFGVSGPAQADLLPGTGTAEQQADEQLARILGQSNGINVENPLHYSTLGTTPVGSTPVAQFKAGQNSPDLNPLLPGESASIKDPRPRPVLPAADVVGSPHRIADDLPVRNMNMPQTSVANMSVFRGLFGGLLPDGDTPDVVEQPTQQQSEAFDGGMPLLGGLGGVLPVNGLPRTGDAPDTGGLPNAADLQAISGLPAGGMAIVPAATSTTPPTAGPAGQQPAAQQPATAQDPATGQQPAGQQPAAVDAPKAGQPKPAHQQKPKPAATVDDPRLHEEPLDSDGTTTPAAPRREFSPDGRPVAGVDQQYK
jgi:hypothetical protein